MLGLESPQYHPARSPAPGVPSVLGRPSLPPWSQGQEDSEGLESCSVTRICWMIPATWELWLPGEDGGGCLVPKPQGLEDAGPGLALCLAQRGCYMKPSDWTLEDGGDTPEGPVTTLESLMWSLRFCSVTEPT